MESNQQAQSEPQVGGAFDTHEDREERRRSINARLDREVQAMGRLGRINLDSSAYGAAEMTPGHVTRKAISDRLVKTGIEGALLNRCYELMVKEGLTGEDMVELINKLRQLGYNV